MNYTPLNSKQIVQESRSNFASSFFFLPANKKRALNVIYAYCRLTDDIVDTADSHNTQDVKNQVEEWRKEVARSFEGGPAHPVLLELSQTVKEFGIEKDLLFQLIDGVAMDIEKKSYETFDQLYLYCYKVASVVGLICLNVFGFRSEKSKEFAVNLGIAFQLTNILRDIKADAEKGRIYIPLEDLIKFGLNREEFFNLSQLNGEKIKAFKDLTLYEAERAESFYEKAFKTLAPEDRSNMLAPEIMSAVYHSILKKIERNPLAILNSKVHCSKPELVFRIFQAWFRNKLA